LRARFDLFIEELACAAWTDEVSRTIGSAKTDLERQGVRLEDFDVAVAPHALAIGATLVTASGRCPGREGSPWRTGVGRRRKPESTGQTASFDLLSHAAPFQICDRGLG
jgi:hypothetical protein